MYYQGILYNFNMMESSGSHLTITDTDLLAFFEAEFLSDLCAGRFSDFEQQIEMLQKPN
jgi:hypothetical protein